MEINLNNLFIVLKKRLWLILLLQFLASISAIFYSLSATELYTSESLLASSSKSNLNSSLGGLAALAGVSIGSSVDQSADSVEYVRSRSMVKHLLKIDPSIAIDIIAAKDYDKENKTIIYDEKIFKDDQWVRNPSKSTGTIEPHYLEVYLYYLDIVKAEYDKLSGFVILSVTHVSPEFAYKLLSMIITQLNQIVKDQDIQESKKAVDFLDSAVSDVGSFDLVASINKLAEKQIETQMLAQSQTHYVLKVIDEPFVPIQRSYPKRSMIVILTSIISFVLIIGLVLILDRKYILEG